MSQHHHHGSSEKHEPGHSGRRRPLHHDWRVWVAVLLMLLAMFAYVASDNEALAPGGDKQPVPAAPAL